LDLKFLYIRRVSKEYQLAFNIVVNAFSESAGPILAFVESPQWATELIRRFDKPIVFCRSNSFDILRLIENAEKWSPSELSILEVNQKEKFDGVIWAFPQKDQMRGEVRKINFHCNEPVDLITITPGLLSRFLAVSDSCQSQITNNAQNMQLNRLLVENGWRLQNRIGLHSISSLLYGLAARMAIAFKRPDWHDRCIFSCRSVYQSHGLLKRLSTVIISTYTKSIN
jgi:hypothetical protein